MKILASRKAAVIATLAALPCVGVGTASYIVHYIYSPWPMDSLMWTTKALLIFLLGCPLTLLYAWSIRPIGKFLLGTIGTDLHFLVVPVFDLIFIIQWIIWSQLIFLIWRRSQRNAPS